MLRVFRLAALMVFAGALASAAPGPAAAQSSTPRIIRVPFAAGAGDGYAGGSVGVQYAFLGCYGELHLALRLAPNSVQTNGVYRMGGKTYTADGAPTQLSVVKVRGRAARAGSEIIGDFTNGAVGPEGGLGCFSGDLTQLGVLTRWLGPKATQAQVVNFLNSLTLQVEPIEAPRNAGLEAKLRSDERQKQAAVEAQQKAAQQEAQAKRTAEAKRAEDAKRPVSPTPTGAGGGYASNAPTPSRPAPAPLSDAERIAKAIESDRLLAQQRLAQQQQQHNQFQQQMAANEAEAQRQSQAVIAAAPALAELGAGLEEMINGWDARRRDRQFQQAMAKWGGKCFANGMAAPKDGLISLGQTINSRIAKEDCGDNGYARFKAYLLPIREPTRVRIRLQPGLGVIMGFSIRTPKNETIKYFGSDDFGFFQRTADVTVQLNEGAYILTVFNTLGNYGSYSLTVTGVDARGRVIATAPEPIQTGEPSHSVVAEPVQAAAPAQAIPSATPTGAAAWGVLAELAGREWSGAGMRHRFVWSDDRRTLSWQQANKAGVWYDWYVFSQNEKDIAVRLAGGRSRGTVSIDPSGVAVARVGSLGATTRFTRNGDGFDVVFRPIPITWQLTPASN